MGRVHGEHSEVSWTGSTGVMLSEVSWAGSTGSPLLNSEVSWAGSTGSHAQ